MKNIHIGLMLLIFIVLSFPRFGFSQDSSDSELAYQVNRIYPSISVTNEGLAQAGTLSDINPYYKSSWIKEYISVEIETFQNGRKRKAVGKNDSLTLDQKDIMKMVDEGTEISVKVLYMPDNTLKCNDSKEMEFSIFVNPESDAQYIEGQQKMRHYIWKHAIDKISDADFDNLKFAAVKFSISEEGSVNDVHVFESTRDEDIDELLLETLCNMPCWKPAEYASGVTVKQDFVLTVGNMQSCVINLLNIGKIERD